jgi:hypothetical protein
MFSKIQETRALRQSKHWILPMASAGLPIIACVVQYSLPGFYYFEYDLTSCRKVIELSKSKCPRFSTRYQVISIWAMRRRGVKAPSSCLHYVAIVSSYLCTHKHKYVRFVAASLRFSCTVPACSHSFTSLQRQGRERSAAHFSS